LAVRSVKIGLCSAALLIALSPLESALAQSSPSESAPAQSEVMSAAGEYVHSEMELVAGIRLNEDGTFEYGLTVGSLDERAKGRWVQAGGRIELTSEPRPVAPTIRAGSIVAAPGEPFALRVVAPNGTDVPGVDFRIDFDSGEPLQDYTTGSPWQVPAGETRTPRFVTFAIQGYRLRSERLPLDARAGSVAMFNLIPNDFGVADLTGVVADISTDGLTLHRPEGTMRFRRTSEVRD